MPIAALLSAYTRRPAGKPRSTGIEATPTPSAAPFTMPANSASPELTAVVFCVATRGPPSAEAPGEAGVRERADRSSLILPRETVDRTGLQH
eukprot:6281626-Alexandrium_andersonii.AAC.1